VALDTVAVSLKDCPSVTAPELARVVVAVARIGGGVGGVDGASGLVSVWLGAALATCVVSRPAKPTATAMRPSKLTPRPKRLKNWCLRVEFMVSSLDELSWFFWLIGV
jgi:hypothetical protein